MSDISGQPGQQLFSAQTRKSACFERLSPVCLYHTPLLVDPRQDILIRRDASLHQDLRMVVSTSIDFLPESGDFITTHRPPCIPCRLHRHFSMRQAKEMICGEEGLFCGRETRSLFLGSLPSGRLFRGTSWCSWLSVLRRRRFGCGSGRGHVLVERCGQRAFWSDTAMLPARADRLNNRSQQGGPMSSFYSLILLDHLPIEIEARCAIAASRCARATEHFVSRLWVHEFL